MNKWNSTNPNKRKVPKGAEFDPVYVAVSPLGSTPELPPDPTLDLPTERCRDYAPHIGAPTVLEVLGFTLEDLVNAYKNSLSERDCAKKLGITHRTLRKYLHKAGVFPDARGNFREIGATTRTSKVYLWIKSQKGVIPRSAKAISEKSGLNYHTVVNFLSKRRKVAYEYLKNLGSPAELPYVRFVTNRGQTFIGKQISQFDLELDLYDLSVDMKVLLRSGFVVNCLMSFNEYCRVLQDEGNKSTELADY